MGSRLCVSRERCGGEARAHGLDDLPRRWHHPEDDQRSSVDHDIAIDEHFVLAVASLDCLDIRSELSPQTRRHTDGMQAGDSERAISYRHARHVARSARGPTHGFVGASVIVERDLPGRVAATAPGAA